MSPTYAISIGPTQKVKTIVAKAVLVLKTDNNTQNEKWGAIGAIIDESFDFRSMSQSLLSEEWKIASTEERRLFVSFFSQYLEDTYRNKLILTKNQSMKILDEQVRKERAVVETQISSGDKIVQVTYRLKNNSGDWFIYDVLIAGVSVVNDARDMFEAIVKAEGIDGLKDDLKNRVNIYKEKHGELPAVP
jgi:phospholipid transport system substrate-binding protein